MFEVTTYRQAKAVFIIHIVIDTFIFLFFVGFIPRLFFIGAIPPIYHLIVYYRQTLNLTEKGLNLKKGLITVRTIEIPYTKINSVSTRRGLLGSMLGYGDIVILSGNDLKGEVFYGIQKPEAVKEEVLSRSHQLENGGFQSNIQAPQQTTQPAPTSYEELEKLAKLKERGVVTQEEFDQKKKKILNL